jgi:hypothetical protein
MNAAAAAKRLSPFGHALSGSGGAVLALAITYPLDVIKTRLQVQTNDSAFTTHYNSMMDALMQIVRNEGIEGLYAGLPSGIIGTASTNFAYFYWYTLIRGTHTHTHTTHTFYLFKQIISRLMGFRILCESVAKECGCWGPCRG